MNVSDVNDPRAKMETIHGLSDAILRIVMNKKRTPDDAKELQRLVARREELQATMRPRLV